MYPNVGDVRGRGLMIGVELVQEKRSREMAGELRDCVIHAAFERGLLILGCGETSIRLCPPLIVTPEGADEALDILEVSLQQATDKHAP
jgi:4-aminobutyrate aminotransferase